MQRDDLLATQQHTLLVEIPKVGHLRCNLLLTGMVMRIHGEFHHLAMAAFLGRLHGFLRRLQPTFGICQRRQLRCQANTGREMVTATVENKFHGFYG